VVAEALSVVVAEAVAVCVSWDWVVVSVTEELVELDPLLLPPSLLLGGDDELLPVSTTSLHVFSCLIMV
jgi:hypothetical protein